MDFSATNAQLMQSGQAQLQAAMVLDKMKLLEKEWLEFWE